jgi:hypothetical protein
MLHISPKSFLKSSSHLEIHGWIGELVIAVSGSGCCSRTWRTVHAGSADRLRGARQPVVLRVLRELLSRFVSIRMAGRFGWLLLAGLSAVSSRTLWISEGSYWWFCCYFRTVRSTVADCPPGVRGPSTTALWTVRPVVRRVPKSFAYLVSLLLWDVWGRRVGRSVVTTRPWQTRVRIFGCEFGA